MKDRIIQTLPFIATVGLYIPELDGRKASVMRTLQKPHAITQFRITVCEGVNEALGDISGLDLQDPIMELLPSVRRLRGKLQQTGQNIALPSLSELSLKEYCQGATDAFGSFIREYSPQRFREETIDGEMASSRRRPYNFPSAVGAALHVIESAVVHHLGKKNVEEVIGNEVLEAIKEVVLLRHADDALRRVNFNDVLRGAGDFYESPLYPILAHASPRGLGWLRREQVKAFISNYREFSEIAMFTRPWAY